MARKYHKVLTIAGSDPSGGAGIQADLKTIASLGCYGLTVVTALTAQSTQGVSAVHPVPVSFAQEQLESLFKDIGADSVKVGMVYSPELIQTVARTLRKYDARPIVLDPMVVSQSGERLLQEEAVAALKEELMPLATIMTPNLPEAECFLGHPLETPEDRRTAVRELASMGSQTILLKGGHTPDEVCEDLLYQASDQRFTVFSGKRIVTKNDHGTGCTLSAAIASYLAMGASLEDAVGRAKVYVAKALRAGADFTLGRGRGPLHHFFDVW